MAKAFKQFLKPDWKKVLIFMLLFFLSGLLFFTEVKSKCACIDCLCGSYYTFGVPLTVIETNFNLFNFHVESLITDLIF